MNGACAFDRAHRSNSDKEVIIGERGNYFFALPPPLFGRKRPRPDDDVGRRTDGWVEIVDTLARSLVCVWASESSTEEAALRARTLRRKHIFRRVRPKSPLGFAVRPSTIGTSQMAAPHLKKEREKCA